MPRPSTLAACTFPTSQMQECGGSDYHDVRSPETQAYALTNRARVDAHCHARICHSESCGIPASTPKQSSKAESCESLPRPPHDRGFRGAPRHLSTQPCPLGGEGLRVYN